MTDYPSLRHATGREICLWLLRRYRRLRVTGESMLPVLSAHQEVLIDPRAYRTRSPQPGDLVVAEHPQQPDLHIVKRVLFVDSESRCYLRGDNAIASTDSRQFGLIALDQIQGKVLCLFP